MIGLNRIRDRAFEYAEKQGFHERPINLRERLKLAVSELSESLEADRNERWCGDPLVEVECTGRSINLLERAPGVITKQEYEKKIRGTVEEELADAIIRLADIAGIYGIDLDWHIKAKMAYNETRPRLHGKRYG
jgi:hypothetical protein